MLAIFLSLGHSYISSHTNEHQMADHQVAEIDVHKKNCVIITRNGYWKVPVVDLSFSCVG